MKESARAAFTYATNNAAILGIPKDRLGAIEAHIHVPAGAIPKDGPSAGIAIATALVSEMSDRPVRGDVSMTGERSRFAAGASDWWSEGEGPRSASGGIKTIIIPKANEADIEDVPEEVRNVLSFHPVETLREVLDIALVPAGTGSVKASGDCGCGASTELPIATQYEERRFHGAVLFFR